MVVSLIIQRPFTSCLILLKNGLVIWGVGFFWGVCVLRFLFIVLFVLTYDKAMNLILFAHHLKSYRIEVCFLEQSTVCS